MKPTRWQQRFENFSAAFNLLESTFQQKALAEFSDLEKEGIVQRFKISFELAWKTLRDYLEHTGITLEQITPREVIKAAFAAHIIQDGQHWIDMLMERNILTHTYNKEVFELAVEKIAHSYVGLLKKLVLFFKDHDK